jgi:hypothetical protein
MKRRFSTSTFVVSLLSMLAIAISIRTVIGEPYLTRDGQKWVWVNKLAYGVKLPLLSNIERVKRLVKTEAPGRSDRILFSDRPGQGIRFGVVEQLSEQPIPRKFEKMLLRSRVPRNHLLVTEIESGMPLLIRRDVVVGRIDRPRVPEWLWPTLKDLVFTRKPRPESYVSQDPRQAPNP